MTENPLGYEKISKLLKNFAVPSIVASLVGSIYNIVDQIFIGQGVGYLGMAKSFNSFEIFSYPRGFSVIKFIPLSFYTEFRCNIFTCLNQQINKEVFIRFPEALQ